MTFKNDVRERAREAARNRGESAAAADLLADEVERAWTEKARGVNYLENVFGQLRNLLPEDVYSSVVRLARAKAGAQAKHSKPDEPLPEAAELSKALEDLIAEAEAPQEPTFDELVELLKGVATVGPERARVMFVGACPSPLEYARKRPLCGLAGEVFQKHYLAPLGLTREDVAIAHLSPVAGEDPQAWDGYAQAEIEKVSPQFVVALGKAAKEALGDRANYFVPHPTAVRAKGNSGEVGRKMRALRKALDAPEQSIVKQFNILGNDDEKRVVTGIVLEPETPDGHDDVVSIDEIEQAAYNFLVQSRVIGDSHSSLAPADLVESFIAPVDFDIGGQHVKKGTWVVSVHVRDEALWTDIKQGHFTGLSIGGTGLREPA